MRKCWQLLATFVLVTAIAVSGHAGPGNGNGGGKGKGKPNKEQKQKPSQAEKEARKAEKLAQKEERKAAKAAEKARKQAEKLAKKAAKNAGSAYSIAEIIVTDSRIVDVTGDYLLETLIVADDGTSATTSVSLALVQDGRGQVVGNAVVTNLDGSVVELPVVGGLELSGDGTLALNLEGALSDGTASLAISGIWDGAAFQSVVTATNLGEEISYDAVIVPTNTLAGFIIEAPLTEQVIGNKVWSDRTVVLPWGNEVVRSQLMTKKDMKFMMHSGNFGIDLRGNVDDAGVVDLSRAKLHLGYGSLWLDPATVEVQTLLPAVQ